VSTLTAPTEGTTATPPPRRFLDAKQVGIRLGCSWRHVLRMADRGLMPWGVKLGALRRWDADQLEAWIAAGCKPCRQGGKG
jgi:predicted DNA-binding transcriptional regulator AlpA